MNELKLFFLLLIDEKLIAVLFFPLAGIYDPRVVEQAPYRNQFGRDLDTNAVIGARTRYALCNHTHFH